MRGFLWAIVGFPLALAALAALSCYFRLFEGVDVALLDKAQLFADFEPDSDIVVVAIDEQSFDHLGAWPWPRAYHAELVDQLAALGAKTIAFDILFSELTDDIDGDLAFAQAIQRHGNVVLPLFIDQVRHKGPVIEIPPVPLFSSVAAAIGHVHIACDGVGVCRSVYLKEGVGEAYWPHISVAVTDLHTGKGGFSGERPAPVESYSPKLIYRDYHNYVLFPPYNKQYRTLSYADVVQDQLKNLSLENAVVFVGATSKGLNDMVLTPSGSIPGVVANAMIFQGLRAGQWIQPASHLHSSIITFCVGFLLLITLSRLSPIVFLLSVVASVCAVIYVSIWLVVAHQYWLPSASLILLLAGYYPLWNWFRLHVALRFLRRYQMGLADEHQQSLSLFGNAMLTSTDITGEHRAFEVVTATIQRLNQLTQVLRENRFLVDQTLSNLQEAVVVTNAEGKILLSNSLAKRYFTLADEDFFSTLAQSFELSDGNASLPMSEFVSRLRSDDNPGSVALEFQRTTDTEGVPSIMLGHAACYTSSELHYPSLLLFTFADITRLKMIERSRFDTLRFLSHDLRSPMVSALALIQQVKEGKTSLDHETQLSKLEDYAKRNLQYSEKIIQAGRAEELNPQRFELCDMHAVVDMAYSQLIDIVQANGSELIIQRDDDDAWVLGDMDALVRMLENLLSNAVKYGGPGGAIRLCLRCEESSVRVEVEDNGPGLSPSQQETIFERFSKTYTVNPGQVNATGVGLGLYYVSLVVQKHRAQITVCSAPGQGCRFIVTFPKAELT